MDQKTRQEILYIHGGDPQNLPYLHFLMSHSSYPALLETLRAKSLRGKLLTEFIVVECKGQPLKFLKWLITETLKVNTPKTPVVGKNDLFY